jgi:tellurite resistance protein TerC
MFNHQLPENMFIATLSPADLSTALSTTTEAAAQYFAQAQFFIQANWPSIQAGLPVVGSLVILEGLLSVDNALVLAAMVKHLPERQSKQALKAGLLGAYIGRGLMLVCASFILKNPWLKILGGAYLIYLMVSNLGQAEEGESEEEAKPSKGGFWSTVLAVELADLAFSVDNVAAAVAMSDKLWAVLTGVAIGILAMRFVAGIFVNLIHKFPVLEQIAYVLVGYIGILLVLEEQGIYSTDEATKFISIIAIIATGMAYSQFEVVRLISNPVLSYVGIQFGNINELTGDVLTVKRAFTEPVSYLKEIASDLVEVAVGLVKPVSDLFGTKVVAEDVEPDAE